MPRPYTRLKRASELGVRALEVAVGRRNAVRAARFLLDRAKLDGPNQIEFNGELLVQRFALRRDHAGSPTIIDVGAHFGEWSGHLLHEGQRLGVEPTLHVFEPSRYSFDRLTQSLAGTARLHLNCLGVSSRTRTALLHKPHDGADSSSLYEHPQFQGTTESVPLTTLDEYCATVGIDHVHLLKVDAEGHDLDALAGAGSLFRDGRVDIAQFEYNARWIDARRYLRDAFSFAERLGYDLGKVSARGIEFYEAWYPELESFKEGNYVLMRPAVRAGIRAVAWWGP